MRVRFIAVLILAALGAAWLLARDSSQPADRGAVDRAFQNEAVQAPAVRSTPEPSMPSAASAEPTINHPYFPIAISSEARRSLPLLERLLTPRSAVDQQWMLQVGYPKLADIDGTVSDEQLRDLADDFVGRGPDAYAANVLAVRLMRRGDDRWRELAHRNAEISPFLARLLLDFELAQTRPNRVSVAEFNRLAMRAMVLGDTEVGRAFERSFDHTPWNTLAATMDELAAANQMLARYGRQTLPIAIRPNRPDGP